MCGIAGFFSAKQHFPTSENALEILKNMADSIQHRGPDGFGYWLNEANIAMVHRRLSIVDLSTAGKQPMHSLCGRYVIVFNGEIYNHLDMRRDLQKQFGALNWKGRTDTETILNGFSLWGIKETLQRSRGMFAFALWDKIEHVLTLGRDRIGEKPLYYGWQHSKNNSVFLFGSELKALKHHPDFSQEINLDALRLYMMHGCIPAPHSIYKGVLKLPPAHIVRLGVNQREPVLEQYWSLSEVAVSGVDTPFIGSDKQAIDELETVLMSAVGEQMQADVPLGAFLSGGVDSSTIVALMQAQSQKEIKTFSVGFDDSNYNEAKFAKDVSDYLGTDHSEIYIPSSQAMDLIPHLSKIYCEPFADPSQIPTFMVSQFAKNDVTVSLTGDGGDELFAGYNRHVMLDRGLGFFNSIPIPVRRVASMGIQAVAPDNLDKLYRYLKYLIPHNWHMTNFGEKMHKASYLFESKSVEEIYALLTTHWVPDDVVIGGQVPSSHIGETCSNLNKFSSVQRLMLYDTLNYLPDDILTKVDRAAMAVSLESRVPFLDDRVIKFAWKLPQSLKLRDGVGKWVLREVLYRHVPRKLIERPKMGFGIPIDSWLRGPLRDWAENLLDETRLLHQGLFNPIPIRKKWLEHLSGKRNWQYHLWDVLMFQSWIDDQINSIEN